MALGNSSDGSGASPSSRNTSHHWEQFRNPQKIDKNEEKLPRHSSSRQRQTRDNMTDSSGNPVHRSRKTIVTEQLFTRQLHNHRQSRESSYTTDSSFDSSDRPRRYLRRDDYSNKENDDFVDMTGVLHLRKPMETNSQNRKKYYEDRGRMEPINWNNDQSNSNESSSNQQDRTPEIKKKPEVPKETLRSIALAKPAASDAFSNFVKNSVHPKVAYNIEGNIETKSSSLDCPLFKIAQLMNKKPCETITIPASVRTSFLPSPPAFHLFNRIDTFKVLDPMKNMDSAPVHTSRQDEAHTSQHRAATSRNSDHSRHRHMPRENMNSRPTHPPRQDETHFSQHRIPNGNSGGDYVSQHRTGPRGNSNCNQYKDMPKPNQKMANKNTKTTFNGKLATCNDVKVESIDQVNPQSTNRSKQTDKNDYHKKYAQDAKPLGNKEEKMVPDLWSTDNCEADNDMVSYVNSLSHEENVAKRESRKQAMEIDDDLFAFVPNPPESSSSKVSILPAPPAREINTCKVDFNRLQKICKEQEKPKPIRSLLAIFKKKENPQPNKTLDSDDTVNSSSDLESASVSMISTRDRLKAYRQKLSEKGALSENQPTLPDENDDRKVLENKNQLLNRCLRASHDYIKVHEDNVIEITNVKVGPRPTPLLKPVSTRYFPKSSTDNNDKSDFEKAEHIKPLVSTSVTTELMNSTPMENLPEDKEKSPEEIDKKDKVEKRQNDVDSGFCIKSIDNSSVAPDISGIKLDSETKNDENCKILKLQELAESTLDLQTERNKICEVELKMEPKNQQPTKSVKDESKFETKKSDYGYKKFDANDIIDYEDFDVENLDLWLPGLNTQVENLQQLKAYGAGNSNQMMSITDYPNNRNNSLESDSESDDNNHSTASASLSSNLKSDSDNPLSPNSVINFDSVFQKVDIKLSELNTSGLDYDYSQPSNFSHQKVSKKDKDVHLDFHPINSTENTSKETSSDIKDESHAGKEEIEQNSSENNDDLSSKHSEKPQTSNEKFVEIPKRPSKKMEKYRSAFKNYKEKLKTKVDTKQNDNNVPQPDNAIQNDNSHPQKILSQRQILKEIQRHKLHLSLRQFV